MIFLYYVLDTPAVQLTCCATGGQSQSFAGGHDMKKIIYAASLVFLLAASASTDAWWGWPFGGWGNNWGDDWLGDAGFGFSLSFGAGGHARGWNDYGSYWGAPYGPYGGYPWGYYPYYGGAPYGWGYPMAAPPPPVVPVAPATAASK
jgi:hypothetical protein